MTEHARYAIGHAREIIVEAPTLVDDLGQEDRVEVLWLIRSLRCEAIDESHKYSILDDVRWMDKHLAAIAIQANGLNSDIVCHVETILADPRAFA